MAQEKYKLVLSEAFEELFKTIKTCKEIDDMLGTSEALEVSSDSTESNLHVLSDGTKQCPCPIHKCSVKTFKIRRHLENIHKDLSKEQKDYAVKIAKVMANNCSEYSTEKSSKTVSKKKAFLLETVLYVCYARLYA